jgi:predicted MFS family arabinose efflux permease
MWVVVPAMLVQAGWVKDDHWQIYLPAVLGSFVVMGGVFPLERRGYLRAVFLSAIALLVLVQLAFLWMSSDSPSITWLAWLLFAFFCGFNVLEATQPSMVSRIAPASSRGAAMGIYNTLQSLGFFAGGLMGGQLAKSYGTQGLFLTCAALMLVWLVVAWPMVAPQRQVPFAKTP